MRKGPDGMMSNASPTSSGGVIDNPLRNEKNNPSGIGVESQGHKKVPQRICATEILPNFEQS